MGSAMQRILCGSLVLSTAILQLACGPKAQIAGEVRDGFGQPLPGVEVTIPATAFKAVSGSDGRFVMPFAPGRFSVQFAKPGYTAHSLAQDVAVETKVPLAPVALYKLPESQGLWAFGARDYVPVQPVKLQVTGGDRTNFAWSYQKTYRVGGQFAQLPRQTPHRFMAQVPGQLVLVKVSSAGVVATRSENFMGFGEDTVKALKDTVQTIAEDLSLREVELQPGRYAYVKFEGDLFAGGRVAEPVFPFEVK